MPLSDTYKNGENGIIYAFSLLLEGGYPFYDVILAASNVCVTLCYAWP